MAGTTITCPECDKVLKLSKPVAPGKSLKCPKCEAVFKVPAEAPASNAKAKSKSPAPAKKSSDKVSPKKGTGKPDKAESKPDKPAGPAPDMTYGVVQENEPAEENKVKINYAPDTSIRDLRGPAQAAVMQPTNFLIMISSIGFFGWVVLIVALLIPIVLPVTTGDVGIKEKPRPILEIADGLGSVNGTSVGYQGGGAQAEPLDMEKVKEILAKLAKGEKLPDPNQEAVMLLFGINMGQLGEFATVQILLIFFVFVLCALFSGTAMLGAVKAQNLESRGWGIAASIMVMMPLTIGGFCADVGMLLGFVLRVVIDAYYAAWVVNSLLSLFQLAALGAGVWGLTVFNQEDVIAGYEFVPE